MVCCGHRYCQNLGQAQIAQQPASPNAYKDYQCVLPLNTIFWILLAEWVGYLLLAIYLDNVVPNENGTRQALPRTSLMSKIGLH